MLACHVCYTGSLEKGARYGLAEREVEKAKLFWHRGDRTHAQTCLDRIINSHYDLIDLEEVKTKSRKEQMAHAEVSFIVILFFINLFFNSVYIIHRFVRCSKSNVHIS